MISISPSPIVGPQKVLLCCHPPLMLLLQGPCFLADLGSAANKLGGARWKDDALPEVLMVHHLLSRARQAWYCLPTHVGTPSSSQKHRDY